MKDEKIKVYNLKDLGKLMDSISDFLEKSSKIEKGNYGFMRRYNEKYYGLFLKSNGFTKDETFILPPWKDADSNNPVILEGPYLKYTWTWGHNSYEGKWARHGISDFAEIPQNFLDWFEKISQ